MAQIDFAVAFVVIFMMVSYAVFFVSNTMTKDFEHFRTMEIEKSQESLSNQLFYTGDNSLVSNFKIAHLLFEEMGGYQHTENIVININPIVDKIHVYNTTMAEISSSISSGNVSFDLTFSENQKRYVNIIYSGNADSMTYNQENNATAAILFEEDIAVLSQDKCNALKSLPYDEAKNIFGFVNDFRIDNYCIYGENPPVDADIIVKSVPILVENQDSTIYPGYVTLKVW